MRKRDKEKAIQQIFSELIFHSLDIFVLVFITGELKNVMTAG